MTRRTISLRSLLLVCCACVGSTGVRAQQPTNVATLENEIAQLKLQLSQLRHDLERRGLLDNRTVSSLSLSNNPSLGSPEAPLVLVEFVDYQCPFCAQHARTVLPELIQRYVQLGIVQYVFKNLPLESIHHEAYARALVAQCANEQGSFAQVHNLLFSSFNGTLDTEKIAGVVPKPTAFKVCVSRSATDSDVRRDMAEADHLAVEGVPTFVVGTRTLCNHNVPGRDPSRSTND